MRKLFVICCICIVSAEAGAGRDIVDGLVRELPGGNIVAGTLLKQNTKPPSTNAPPVANIQNQQTNIQHRQPSLVNNNTANLLVEYSRQITSLQKQIHDERESHSNTKDSLESALKDSGVPLPGVIAGAVLWLITLGASALMNVKFIRRNPEIIRIAKQLSRSAFKSINQELQQRAANSKDGTQIQAIADAQNALAQKQIDAADEIEEKLSKIK